MPQRPPSPPPPPPSPSPAQIFKHFAFTAADTLGIVPGRLLRGLGLKDLLDNGLLPTHSPVDVAIKAMEHFCDDAATSSEAFQVASMAICSLLKSYSTHKKMNIEQALVDMIRLFESGKCSNKSRRDWIRSHFGL